MIAQVAACKRKGVYIWKYDLEMIFEIQSTLASGSGDAAEERVELIEQRGVSQSIGRSASPSLQADTQRERRPGVISSASSRASLSNAV